MTKNPSSDVRVELGPRAVDDPVARELRRRIIQNLERRRGLGAFQRMWGTVVVVAVLPTNRDASDSSDPEISSQTTLTLRFDWGRLMIHEGRVGRPDVTLWGPVDALLSLGDGPALRGPRGRLSAFSATRALSPLWAFTNLLSTPEVRIYGLSTHWRLVWRLARLLSLDEVAPA